MIIYTAPNQVGASQISQIFTIPRLVASEVSHLLSHDFTHILYFFFVFQYKTQREPEQPADNVDRPPYLLFSLI